ncbi:type II toxin-antitoxin system MqsR family toxin [Pseudomonas sp. TWP3-2]|uniref:type II toxin-antitoxin system MqsR family toxin n=1 Tax=Pseudomonas sp. TWP3-2 TaxID=2804574 RepID=UPI003CEEE28B
MEKHTPHYDLAVVREEVLRMGAEAFTMTAREGGRKMGLSIGQMLRVVYLLEYRMLHKSMTSHADHRVWQDVYYSKFENREIYIKVTYRPRGGHPVISFKEKHP